jgi:hypothetical protein
VEKVVWIRKPRYFPCIFTFLGFVSVDVERLDNMKKMKMIKGEYVAKDYR